MTQIILMSHNNQFKTCRDCIRSLHSSAHCAGQHPYRKVHYVTLRYFIVRNRVLASVRQHDDKGFTILHFLFLLEMDSAIPLYMFHLLPDAFPFVLQAFPYKEKSTNISKAFINWFVYQDSYRLPVICLD